MKIVLFVSCFMALLSSAVYAGNDCEVIDAHVVSVMTWPDVDGIVFINLDKANNCGCSIPKRFAFYLKDPFAKTYLAQALTAHATKGKISILGNSGCYVHDTSEIFSIILGDFV